MRVLRAPAARGGAAPPAGGALGAAALADRERRPRGEDPHLQLPREPGHRPPHQAHAPPARRRPRRRPGRAHRGADGGGAPARARDRGDHVVSPLDAVHEVARELDEAGVPSPRVDAELLVADVLGVSALGALRVRPRSGDVELARLRELVGGAGARASRSPTCSANGASAARAGGGRAGARAAARDRGGRRALPRPPSRARGAARPRRRHRLGGDRARDRRRAPRGARGRGRPLRGGARARAREPGAHGRWPTGSSCASATSSTASPGRSTWSSRTRRTSRPRSTTRSSPRSGSTSPTRPSSATASGSASPPRRAASSGRAATSSSSAATARPPR